MARKSRNKSSADISREWDVICHARQAVIEQGKDISLTAVTAPCILRNVGNDHPHRLLDVGCGSGYLTSRLSEVVDDCLGIDISGESIKLAQKLYSADNLQFQCSSIAEFNTDAPFDACVSNMVFMSDPDWLGSIRHIFDLLKPDGRLYFTITHPCFWPRYWNYQNESWFDYRQEIFIEGDFGTSLAKSIGTTTHIHRPMSQYFNGIISSGFTIESVEEPYPVKAVPEGYTYEYPRFLFFKCRKP